MNGASLGAASPIESDGAHACMLDDIVAYISPTRTTATT